MDHLYFRNVVILILQGILYGKLSQVLMGAAFDFDASQDSSKQARMEIVIE